MVTVMVHFCDSLARYTCYIRTLVEVVTLIRPRNEWVYNAWLLITSSLTFFRSVTWLATGNWTNWSNWNECTRTCGAGIQFRKRVCIHPKGELFCLGEKVQSRLCNSHHCPGNIFILSWLTLMTPWSFHLNVGSNKVTENLCLLCSKW